MINLSYDELDSAILSTLDSVEDIITKMATISAMVFHADHRFDWVGFYRNVGGDLLEIGPYQGALGCLKIPFEKGVCGYVARTGEPIIVPDVHAFEGHIACSSLSQSEMVLPVKNKSGELLAVFDLDSNQKDAFMEGDMNKLMTILNTVFADNELENR